MGRAKAKIRLEDVARIAGVSIATVSRALNESPAVKRITHQRIWNIAVAQGYIDPGVSHVPAKSPRCRIGIFISSGHHDSQLLFNPFYQQMVASLGQAARSQGCDMLLSNLPLDEDVDLAGLMDDTQVDAAVFIGQCRLHDRFNRLADTNRNFVVWGQQAPGQKYRTVGSDNLRGGQLATAHLLALGRRRIVYLGETDGMEVRLRFQGYLDALDARGVTFRPDLVVPVASDTGAACEAVTALIDRGASFDGIFAASDAMAFGAMDALRAARIEVPSDVSVVGYDDTPQAALSRPRVTAVSQDLAVSGALMVSKLVGTGANDRGVSACVATRLVIRESCGDAMDHHAFPIRDAC